MVQFFKEMASHKSKPYDKRDRGGYPRENLKIGVYDVVNGILSVHAASTKYGVPERTIQHHVKYVPMHNKFYYAH